MAVRIETYVNGKKVGKPVRVKGRHIIDYKGEPDEAMRGFVQVLHHDAMEAEQKGDQLLKDVFAVGYDEVLTSARPSAGAKIRGIDHRRKLAILAACGDSIAISSKASGGFGSVQEYRFTRVK